jgi:hypothetical protein
LEVSVHEDQAIKTRQNSGNRGNSSHGVMQALMWEEPVSNNAANHQQDYKRINNSISPSRFNDEMSMSEYTPYEYGGGSITPQLNSSF